ncbi:MAG: CBS domain-containing protein [Trichococcus sp.]|jgi:predicted transcriptional regulator|uniref:DRTGG domain-containing protein n=1 Tax=Trichococcus flocculiformis TaxID=82803 RepID=UPI001B3CD8E7|nr:DRTGG domain-containing protein [Trichococcus flocculiformis]MBP6165166.1 CBS domain-containing protein [Trichococcus sp.]MBP6247132.1 CBS domain-containing protein [Trichococcus sp.]MBP7128516.1 CBS domain-containing protein [Trichococcus sp.]MBP8683049.1 CBS domain-containing protein [Trichococcus sp.]MBP9593771.1 CBS domain-containing protein [Trichococcus sp.]
MATKHEQIIQYIETMPVGEKLSVRTIAKNLNMSEGTAYRAIKDAENIGLVSTIERVGTIRIERKSKENIETLTFGQICKIIDGDILGGKKGLDKTLSKFIIGAMQREAMERYISPGSLMIVGNRNDIQEFALEKGAAVLITGGFDTDESIVHLADQVEMPILRTTYDTFTVATMINRAMTDQLIKKEIMLVEDIYTPIDETKFLSLDDTVFQYRNLNTESTHSRFPIVNHNMRLVGIITAKDILGKADTLSLERVMTRDPIVAKTHMSVASVAHRMIWDGLEVMPVVKDNLQLLGIISRQDVMKAMQLAQRQPQVGNTIEDQVVENLSLISSEEGTALPSYNFRITPQMTNSLGTVSFGVLSEVLASTTKKILYTLQKRNAVIEQMDIYHLKMIQIDSVIEIRSKMLELGRRSSKLDVEVYLENSLVGKAIVICQLMEKS